MGLVQLAKLAPSSAHSKVRSAAGVRSSLPLKLNAASVLLVGFAGMLSIVVSGGVISGGVVSCTS